MKVWMRGRLACSRLLAARSTSKVQQRASAATCAQGNSRLTASTAWKSPSLAMGKPASRMSTPSSTSFRAIFSFSGTVMLQPGDCSPSRRVVSKMYTRSLTRALSPFGVRFSKFIMLAVHISKCYIQSSHGSSFPAGIPHRRDGEKLLPRALSPFGVRFSKFIMLAVHISKCYIQSSHGSSFPAGIPHRRDGEKLLPRGGQIVAHAAGDLALLAAAGAGTGRETDRPVGKGSDPDRRRAFGAGVRAALPEPASGNGQLDRRTARQFGGAADHRGQRIHHPLPVEAHRELPRDVPEGEGAGAAEFFEQTAQRAIGRQPGAGGDQLRSGR